MYEGPNASGITQEDVELKGTNIEGVVEYILKRSTQDPDNIYIVDPQKGEKMNINVLVASDYKTLLAILADLWGRRILIIRNGQIHGIANDVLKLYGDMTEGWKERTLQ